MTYIEPPRGTSNVTDEDPGSAGRVSLFSKILNVLWFGTIVAQLVENHDALFSGDSTKRSECHLRILNNRWRNISKVRGFDPHTTITLINIPQPMTPMAFSSTHLYLRSGATYSLAFLIAPLHSAALVLVVLSIICIRVLCHYYHPR